ncbi:hypothetical protein ES695_20310 [Candidatus Atribacteria bacterium 1244-E10-H5-B2]|nr:MAG: hypothetical protein ES695_20310 [Candidatus Atribacteria bacterium 1244-E10-H5-B2]
MNIFNRFRNIKKRNKYKELERLFDEVVTFFPKGHTSMMIHDIDLKELDRRRWAIKSDNTAARQEKSGMFDITLFGKDK